MFNLDTSKSTNISISKYNCTFQVLVHVQVNVEMLKVVP